MISLLLKHIVLSGQKEAAPNKLNLALLNEEPESRDIKPISEEIQETEEAA